MNLNEGLGKKPASGNVMELRAALIQEWEAITLEILKRVIQSMCNCLKSIIRNRGVTSNIEKNYKMYLF